SVITKIAAGEVIERPASVVKELLENSVDAGSSRIDIDIEQGGVELIRVVDNGCGILADDLRLAFADPATSKLSTAEELFPPATRLASSQRRKIFSACTRWGFAARRWRRSAALPRSLCNRGRPSRIAARS